MVSNWLPSNSRARCGNSTVATPQGASRSRIPATKSLRSGTWASTLLATSRSARRPEAEALEHLLAVAAGVVDPGGRVGREVGVLGEDLLRADVLLELDQQAAFADVHAQRVERLHLVELVGAQVALARWRHAQVDHQVGERRPTEAAVGRPRGGGCIGARRQHGCTRRDPPPVWPVTGGSGPLQRYGEPSGYGGSTRHPSRRVSGT